MNVLVTGVGGQVGRAVMRGAPPDAAVVGLSHAELDIGDADAVASCVRKLRPQLIVNAAAYTAVDNAEKDPASASRVNTDGPFHLAGAAAEVGARLIHISTDYVFDGQSAIPYAPEAPTAPLNIYGRTKLAGEGKVLEWLPETAVILRTAWVYAAEGGNFLGTMLRLMRERGTVRVVADQVGTPTSATSVASAIWKLAERPQLRGIFHWTDSGVASWYDFAVAIAEEGTALQRLPAGVQVVPIGTVDYPTPAARPRFSVLEKRSTIAALGCTPPHWRSTLRRTLGEMTVA